MKLILCSALQKLISLLISRLLSTIDQPVEDKLSAGTEASVPAQGGGGGDGAQSKSRFYYKTEELLVLLTESVYYSDGWIGMANHLTQSNGANINP